MLVNFVLVITMFCCRAAITKMTEVSTQFGGDMASLEAQLQESAKDLQKAQGLLYQYQVGIQRV